MELSKIYFLLDTIGRGLFKCRGEEKTNFCKIKKLNAIIFYTFSMISFSPCSSLVVPAAFCVSESSSNLLTPVGDDQGVSGG